MTTAPRKIVTTLFIAQVTTSSQHAFQWKHNKSNNDAQVENIYPARKWKTTKNKKQLIRHSSRKQSNGPMRFIGPSHRCWCGGTFFPTAGRLLLWDRPMEEGVLLDRRFSESSQRDPRCGGPYYPPRAIGGPPPACTSSEPRAGQLQAGGLGAIGGA